LKSVDSLLNKNPHLTLSLPESLNPCTYAPTEDEHQPPYPLYLKGLFIP